MPLLKPHNKNLNLNLNHNLLVTVHGFKGCILTTIRHFVDVLYGKTDCFHMPTNLEHCIWQLCGKTSIFFTRTSDLEFCPCP